MDKQQKEFLKSYFRARKLNIADAYEHDDDIYDREFEQHELIYLVSKKMVDPKNMSGANIGDLLTANPQYLEHVKPYLKKMNYIELAAMLRAQPQLTIYFKDRIWELEEEDVYDIEDAIEEREDEFDPQTIENVMKIVNYYYSIDDDKKGWNAHNKRK